MDAQEKEKPGKTQFGVQSMEVGLRILDALAHTRRPMALKQLADTLAMAPAKAHRYLVSLVREGMVEQDGSGGAYALGPLAVSVGLAALHQLDLVRVAGEAAAELRGRTNETVLLAIWGSEGPTIVRWEECRRPMAVNFRVGSVLSMDSASGLLFAAFLPYHSPLARQMHERGDDVKALLAEIRRRGMAVVRGNQLASINAMSAPIFDHMGRIAAAITVLGPARRFSVDWDSQAADELKAVARKVSGRLGFQQGGALPALHSA